MTRTHPRMPSPFLWQRADGFLDGLPPTPVLELVHIAYSIGHPSGLHKLRLYRMALMGGAHAVEEAGGNAMLLKLAPLINQLEARIAASEALNLALIERLETLIKSRSRAGG